MVNPGRPSRACATCKQRKIKCDQSQPTCTPCARSGWACPGIPLETDVRFRNQTDLVARNFRRGNLALHLLRANRPAGTQGWAASPTRAPSSSLADRGTAFFLRHYVHRLDDESTAAAGGGIHEYIPALLRQEGATESFKTILAAAGLAALVNVGNTAAWRFEAYRLYNNSIRHLKSDLNDPVRVKLDHTLVAVMLMGTFEAIASGDAESMKSFAHHTLAAALCIEMRGPCQFRTASSVKMFLQMRRIIVQTCHQLQEPIPYALRRWSSWVESLQSEAESASNRFSEINERLAIARADIKRKGICSPSAIATRLLRIDGELETWRRDLPASWVYKSYRDLRSTGSLDRGFTGWYDMYPDLWIASAWNNYRTVRLLIHETIIKATIKYGAVDENPNLDVSMAVLQTMTRDICNSVICHLGGPQLHDPTGSQGGISRAIPGGYMLMWPLFLSGMLRTTPMDQRRWIAAELRKIGVGMGLRLAISMATLIEEQNKSFSDSEVWLIGHFFP
ncbi:Uncharacterized protein TPAR_01972 [Tolypocladium paradoxum]|uniref:Zn(2)-C6 fungal-type domain-containing protein n=1 Tax=Tolypocladium paradoxum TaxID=94208 RepID=A0A2S4L5X6_9HYPO|nr:Uncharacterized protein TPAR_01972 [Tolypocladium paradoxum]